MPDPQPNRATPPIPVKPQVGGAPVARPAAQMPRQAVQGGPALDLAAEFKKVRDLYTGNARTNSYNALVMGDPGSGKTFLLRTCRKPVFIHSFDQNGASCLGEFIEKGEVLVDSRWENHLLPELYKTWDAEMQRLIRGNFFQHVGTFVIDSATTWGEMILNEILKRAGRKGQVPEIQDYLRQMLTMKDYIKQAASLPCDFILTAHMEIDKDELTGKIESSPLVTGKLARYLPILFDESYVVISRPVNAEKNERVILTDNDGRYKAKSRLSAGGKLKKLEEADISKMLEKVGKRRPDLPLFL